MDKYKNYWFYKAGDERWHQRFDSQVNRTQVAVIPISSSYQNILYLRFQLSRFQHTVSNSVLEYAVSFVLNCIYKLLAKFFFYDFESNE